MKVLRVELFKIFHRRRSYIGFAAVLVMVVLLATTFHYEGSDLFGFITQNLEETFVLQGNIVNGNLLAYIVLKSLWVHFPILIALVIGDAISGEEESGTLRLILTRPVSRVSLITAKFLSGIVYVIALVAFMAIVSISIGYAAFGQGDLLVLMSKLNIFAADDVLWRFGLAYTFGALSMCTVAAFAIFMSGIMKNTLSAILGAIAILIVLNFFSLFNIPILNWTKPFLFTTYMTSWHLFFDYNLNMPYIFKSAAVLISYIFIFYGITVYYFNRKDVLS